MDTVRIQAVVATLAVVGAELALAIGIAKLLDSLVAQALGRVAAGRRETLAESSRRLRLRLRTAIGIATLAVSALIVSYNGWLAARGVNAWARTSEILATVGRDVWLRAGTALAKVIAAALIMLTIVFIVRRGVSALERALRRSERIASHDQALHASFIGLHHIIIAAGWISLVVFGCWLFNVPDHVLGVVVTITRAYFVVAVGLLMIRASALIVDVLDLLGQRYAEAGAWKRHYDHLRPLVPTFRACLEYALWIAVAAVAIAQLGQAESAVMWGPRLIEAIGLFFFGRVLIELGHMEIERRMLPPAGLDEMSRRRRTTIAPIVRNTFTYAVYFGTIVLILASLGFNPMPFLAGAGILGLVIGFGAQALIHDVVSGFFILFENTYLVGDAIEATGAKGIVEAIEFRTTKLRDADGRLHIIRNGDVKQVVNYSKEYALAVVAVDVAYDADLPQVFAILREAGERTRRDNPDVLGETQIEGISAFGLTTMTVRTSTRVRPGRHEATAAVLRLAIKDAFDRRSATSDRKSLVPDKLLAVVTPVADARARWR
jgi:moderate conductance mechanosensitive channel